jgi:regulator of cell morphogenesis and NO signaling
MATETQIERKTVRELVLEKPAAARIFEKLGIDYCCGGEKSLIDACAEAKVNVEDVFTALAKPESVSADRDWRDAPLSELAQYIVDKHHSFTRDEIKRLVPLISKVVSVHGKNHPELLQVQSLFWDLAQELTMHMGKEEQVLFPYIAKMDQAVQSNGPLPRAMYGTVQNPVQMMVAEHDSSGRVLHKMREVTNGYVPPPDGCVTYQTLYCALEAFEKDLHNHIHLENNILFPRSVDLEMTAR